MEKTTIILILLAVWTLSNLIWTIILHKRESFFDGAMHAVSHLCDSLAKALGFNPEENQAKEEGDKNKATETIYDNAEYSGVIHVFNRNGKHHERPVMEYKYRGETQYFEWDDNGKMLKLPGKEYKEAIANVLKGEKERHFKLYELSNK